LVQKLSKLVTTRNSVAKVFFLIVTLWNHRGLGPTYHLENFGDPYLRPNSLPKTNKIL